MLASTLIRPPVEAGLAVPELSAQDHFDTISCYVEVVLVGLGAGYEIIDPTVALLEPSWNPAKAKRTTASRQNVLEAIRAVPDVVAGAEAIQWVTGKCTDPVRAVVTDLFHDVEKPTLEEEIEHSQEGKSWPIDKRWNMMPHVLLSKETVEASALPDVYRGEPLKQYAADVIGESHSIQPEPSFEYGCGHNLGRKARRTLGAVAASDWRGAKFERDNAGNRDEHGQPLSDEVRSQQFGMFLGYHFGDFWTVNDHNNPIAVAQAVYVRYMQNHPSRVHDIDPIFFSLGVASRGLRARKYHKLSFSEPSYPSEPRQISVSLVA